MKKFVLIILLYLIPIIAYVSLGEIILFNFNENYSIGTIVEKQHDSKNESYYSRSFFANSTSLYKYKMMTLVQPEIVTIGQSIVLQYRDFFFHPHEEEFYNGGQMVHTTADIKKYVELIKGEKIKKPKFIIVGLEFTLIKEKSLFDLRPDFEEVEDEALDTKAHLRVIQNLFMEREYKRNSPNNYGYGIRGKDGEGFRKDGSRHNRYHIIEFLESPEYKHGKVQKDFRLKTHPFNSPLKLDTLKAKLLKSCFKDIENLGIELLIYVAPLSDSFYKILLEDKDFAEMWSGFLNFQEEIKEKGHNVIDFCTPSKIGLNDLYMNNANHPGEVMVAIQFLDFLKKNKSNSDILNSIDIKNLENIINNHSIPISFQKDSLMIYDVKNN